MKKITELTEERWRTIHFKDAYGNRQRDTEEYIGKRYVKGIAPGKRFKYFLIDLIAFRIIFSPSTFYFLRFQVLLN